MNFDHNPITEYVVDIKNCDIYDGQSTKWTDSNGNTYEVVGKAVADKETARSRALREANEQERKKEAIRLKYIQQAKKEEQILAELEEESRNRRYREEMNRIIEQFLTAVIPPTPPPPPTPEPQPPVVQLGVERRINFEL